MFDGINYVFYICIIKYDIKEWFLEFVDSNNKIGEYIATLIT